MKKLLFATCILATLSAHANVNLRNLTKDDVFHSIEVDADITVEDLKCILEIESSIPVLD